MQARRLLTAGIWLAATVAATALVWTATSVVAEDVTDRPPTVVAPQEVAQALEEVDTGPPPAPPVTAPQRSTQARPPASTAPPVTAPPPEPPAPAATTTLPPPITTTTTAPPAPTTTAAPAPDPTATFATSGGVVTATCSGFFIRLVAATPADGYSVDVLDRGPGSVHVHFVGRAGEEVRVRLVCFSGRPIRVPDQHEEDQNAYAGSLSTTGGGGPAGYGLNEVLTPP